MSRPRFLALSSQAFCLLWRGIVPLRSRRLLYLLAVGLATGTAFALCWAPLLPAWRDVVRRVFPFDRGVYEGW